MAPLSGVQGTKLQKTGVARAQTVGVLVRSIAKRAAAAAAATAAAAAAAAAAGCSGTAYSLRQTRYDYDICPT